MTLYQARNNFHLRPIYVANYLGISPQEYLAIEEGILPLSDKQYIMLKELFATDFTIHPTVNKLLTTFDHDAEQIKKLEQIKKFLKNP